MADLRPYPTTGDENEASSTSTTRARRWGKRVGKIILVLLVVAPILAHLILIVVLGGPGRLHGP